MTYRKTLVLAVGILLGLIVLGLALAVPEAVLPARALLAIPVIFFFPGYALIKLMAPRHGFPLPELIVFSLGLSIILSIAATFLLNLTPWGLHLQSWSVMVVLLDIVLSGIALIRLRALHADDVATLPIVLGRSQVILLAVAGAIAMMAWLMNREGAALISPASFTQLWILPKANQPNVVTLGIRNMESGPMRFRLEIRHDENVLQIWPEINVAQGAVWQGEYTLPADRPAQKLEVFLYRLDQPAEVAAYRNVSYWYEPLATATAVARPAAP